MNIGEKKKVGKSKKRIPKRDVDEPIPVFFPEKETETAPQEAPAIPIELPVPLEVPRG